MAAVSTDGARVPKNFRSKRALEDRSPKTWENAKRVLCLKGPKASHIVNQILKEVQMLKKPDARMMTKRNVTRPFEDISMLEFLCKKNDSSLFLFGSHTKKRPNNLVFGRMFDWSILDMIEFGVNPKTFKSIKSLIPSRSGGIRSNGKPMFVFIGDWAATPALKTAQNLLLDFFRGEIMEEINLKALDHVIVCTAYEKKFIFFRHYCVRFKKSGSKVPRVELVSYGPSMDLVIRRFKTAPIVVQYHSMRKPKRKAAWKRKNQEQGDMDSSLGRLHLSRQEMKKLQLRKMKGLKKRKKPKTQEQTAPKKKGKFA